MTPPNGTYHTAPAVPEPGAAAIASAACREMARTALKVTMGTPG